MAEALDDIETEYGGRPAYEAAEYLHRKLMIRGYRHVLEADDDTGTVVLRIPPFTAGALALALTEDRDRAGS